MRSSGVVEVTVRADDNARTIVLVNQAETGQVLVQITHAQTYRPPQQLLQYCQQKAASLLLPPENHHHHNYYYYYYYIRLTASFPGNLSKRVPER